MCHVSFLLNSDQIKTQNIIITEMNNNNIFQGSTSIEKVNPLQLTETVKAAFFFV